MDNRSQTQQDNSFPVGEIISGVVGAGVAGLSTKTLLDRRDYNAAPVPSHLSTAPAHARVEAILNMDEKTREWLLREHVDARKEELYREALSKGISEKEASASVLKKNKQLFKEAEKSLQADIDELRYHFDDLTSVEYGPTRTFKLHPKGSENLAKMAGYDPEPVTNKAKAASQKLSEASTHYFDLAETFEQSINATQRTAKHPIRNKITPRVDVELELKVQDAARPQAEKNLADAYKELRVAASEYLVDATRHGPNTLIGKILHMSPESAKHLEKQAQRFNSHGGEFGRTLGVATVAGIGFVAAEGLYNTLTPPSPDEQPTTRIKSPELLTRQSVMQAQTPAMM
jgi:hypothetical protein